MNLQFSILTYNTCGPVKFLNHPHDHFPPVNNADLIFCDSPHPSLFFHARFLSGQTKHTL